jgi:hypothetical protein
MKKTWFALAALAAPLLLAPPSIAGTFPAVLRGDTAALIAVDFSNKDLRGLIRAMGYHIVSIDKGKHGWVVIGTNQDGTWKIVVDKKGSVRQVTHLSYKKKHQNDDDEDDDDDGGDDA